MLKNGQECKKRNTLRNSVDEESIVKYCFKMDWNSVNKMLDSEKQKVLRVEEVLKQDVIGQDEAIKAN